MFKRCFICFALIITSISIIILFAFTKSTSASGVQEFFETPNEVKARLIALAINKYNRNLTADQKTTICETIIHEATQTEFDPLLISSVIAAESSFMPKAVSPCSARGLMQLTDCVAEIMQINNPFDIQENIYAGTRYLKDLRRMFKDMDLTLAAYNAGPTRVARLKRVPRISETINYIKKVQRFYEVLQNQFQIAMLNSVIQPVCFKPEAPSTHKPQYSFGCQIKIPPLTSPYFLSANHETIWTTRNRKAGLFNLYPYSKNNLQYS